MKTTDRCETAENRELLEIEKLVPAHTRRGNTPRAQCLRAITCLVGEGALQAFMQAPQPALGDRTGAELLQEDPEGLLEHLRTIESARDLDDDFDDLVEIDPYVSGTNNRCTDMELSKMLDLIDSLPISSGKEGAH